MLRAVLFEVSDHVAVLTLNRPEMMNAIDEGLKDDLAEAMTRAAVDTGVRAVVIQGAGRSFCAGGDIKTMGKRTAADSYRRLGTINRIIMQLTDLEKPVIASVHGQLAGAGVSLALAADVIFAAEDAVFHLSFSRLGLMADAGGTYWLSRLLGPYRTKELLFDGGRLTAEEGYRYGLVNRIYPVDRVHEEALVYARKLVQGPTLAYAQIKRAANRSLHLDLASVLELERQGQVVLQQTADHFEGLNAFRERREPRFGGI